MDNNYKFDPMTGEPIVKETVSEQPAEPQYEAPQAPQYEAPQAPQYDAPAAPQYDAPQAPQYDAPQYAAPAQPAAAPAAENSRGKAIAGMVMSICSISLCWLGLYFGFFGAIPIVLSILGKKFSAGVPPFEKPGRICGTLGLIFSIIFAVIGFILLIVGASMYY